MAGNLEHVFHSALVSVLAYLIMVFLLKQSNRLATNRSVLLFALLLTYMSLFGHSFPPRLNRSLF